MMFNPHKLGIHKILSKIPLNAIFDAPYKARLRKAVNIADLRVIAKSRAHKVRSMIHDFITMHTDPRRLSFVLPSTCDSADGVRLSRCWWR